MTVDHKIDHPRTALKCSSTVSTDISTDCSSSSITANGGELAPTTSFPRRVMSQEHWWQRAVVKRSLAAVKDSTDRLTAGSHFLQQERPSTAIAMYKRSEIVIGPLVGTGGFSNVYEIASFQLDSSVSAQYNPDQQKLREEYAQRPADFCIKYLKEHLLKSPKEYQCALSDLAIEAAYMSRIEHPHILSVKGLPHQGISALQEGQYDAFFIISDRLTETLDEKVHKKWKSGKSQVSVHEKLLYSKQLAEALLYLHQHRIIFRDLKPQNIGFSETGCLRLLDFGLCRELPIDADCDETYVMSGVGTRRYMAPELINTGRYNLKADVYGWAIVTWEMMSGSKPYPKYSANDHRVIVCQAGERPPLCSTWLVREILQSSWCESVSKRWSMEQVVTELSKVMKTTTDMQQDPMSPFVKKMIHTALQDSPIGVEEYQDYYNVDNSMPSMPELSLSAVPTPISIVRRVATLEPKRTSLLNFGDRMHDQESSLSFCIDANPLDSSLLGFSVKMPTIHSLKTCDAETEDLSFKSMKILNQEMYLCLDDGNVEVVCSYLKPKVLCDPENRVLFNTIKIE